MNSDNLNRAIIVILALCILASASFLAYAVLVPHQDEPFTGFYILDADGNAGNYPARMHLGDTAPVIVGIENHEHRDMAYDLVVLLNASGNVSRLYGENVPVAQGQTWEKKIGLTPGQAGNNMKIELLLYADGNYSAPYRDLRLWVDVLQPPIS